jgi:pleuromutilin/lincosamide/streptogramin A transport system ATP-binding/permease protein
MLLLEAQHILYEVEGRKILNIENLKIQKGDCIGVVGKNGSGKTSLVHILTGKIDSYSGTIHTEATAKLLPQLKPMDSLQSGGEVTQQYINHALATKADILFADEPTTNLDKEHIETLENQLKRWHGSVVIVSHDRAFLDSLCNKIWEIKDAKLTEYKGSYSAYQVQKEIEINKQNEDYHHYISKKQQLERALELKKKKAARATKSSKKKDDSEANLTGAKPYFAKKQKKLETTANAIKTRLDKLEKIEKVKEEPPLNMNVTNEEILGNKPIIRVEEIEGRVGTRVLWKAKPFQIRAGDKVAIIGENGVGKTTFIKSLINGRKGILVAPSLRIGYFSQNLDILNVNKSILENVMETSSQEISLIRTVLARLHFFKDDIDKPILVLSGGERVKVAFAKIFLSDINTIILDEPTNYLDITAVEALESLLHEYRGTVVFVSHDRRFIQKVAKKIISIENQSLQLFNGDYKSFLEYEPQKMDSSKEKLMVIETKLTDVLSRISISSTPELEEEFQKLLKEKRKLQEEL